MKINYQSDFDFYLAVKDCNGGELVNYYFKGIISNLYDTDCPYIFENRYGNFKNCSIEDNKIHIFVNNHKLKVGQLKLDFEADIPNAGYPDGLLKIKYTDKLDINLVPGNTDLCPPYSIDIALPYLIETAYDLAVLNGYTGTRELYIQAMTALPEVYAQNEEILNRVNGALNNISIAINTIHNAVGSITASTNGVVLTAELINIGLLELASNINNLNNKVIGIELIKSDLQTLYSSLLTIDRNFRTNLLQALANNLTYSSYLDRLSSYLNNCTDIINSLLAKADSFDTILNTGAENLVSEINNLSSGVETLTTLLSLLEDTTSALSRYEDLADVLEANSNQLSESNSTLLGTVSDVVDSVETLTTSIDLNQRTAAELSNIKDEVNTATDYLQDLIVNWQLGKKKIVNALRLKDVEATESDTFDKLAQDIIDIPRKVEYEEGAITPQLEGIPYSYMLLILHDNRKDDYPYMVGVSFPAEVVNLVGADYYKCSDGFETSESLQRHMFIEPKAQHWIIYYYRNERYTIPRPEFPLNVLFERVNEYIVYNGIPSLLLLTGFIGNFWILPEEMEYTTNGLMASGAVDNFICNLKVSRTTMTIQTRFNSVCFPQLEEVSIAPIMSYANAVWVPITNNNLTISWSFPKLKRLYTWLTQACLMGNIMYFPELETIDSSEGLWFVGSNKEGTEIHFYLPKLNYVMVREGTFIHNQNIDVNITLHLGRQLFAERLEFRGRILETSRLIKAITVEEGFRSSLIINELTYISAESLHNLILNLGDNRLDEDNNPATPLTLNLGAANVAKLSLDDINHAEELNYTIIG